MVQSRTTSEEVFFFFFKSKYDLYYKIMAEK